MGVGQELCRDYAAFECPVCGNRRYYRIVIVRENRPRYRTDFFGCVGCSALFTDAYQFTQGGKQPAGNFGSATYKR
jgi:predicted RNA-binding Zn-ribbon protein involved in translation (DUF1610 family)